MERKENMPSWAYWGLWGIKSRKAAMVFFITTMVLALIIVPIGIILKYYISAAVVVLAPLWYWLSIRWVDKNSAWEKQIDKQSNT